MLIIELLNINLETDEDGNPISPNKGPKYGNICAFIDDKGLQEAKNTDYT